MKNQEESRTQQACVKWLKLQYPKVVIFAVPNQGARNVKNASRMKAEGMLAGFPDIGIMKPNKTHAGLFVEMKAAKGKLSPAQKEVHAKLLDAGYRVEVCRSVEEFIEVVNNYLNNQKPLIQIQ